MELPPPHTPEGYWWGLVCIINSRPCPTAGKNIFLPVGSVATVPPFGGCEATGFNKLNPAARIKIYFWRPASQACF